MNPELGTGPLGQARQGTRPALDRALLAQAAQWLVRLKDGPLDDRDAEALARWVARSEQHRQAWALAQAMQQQLDGMPAGLARPVLARTAAGAGADAQRRRTVRTLAALLATGLLAAGVQRAAPWRPLLADFATGTGARRQTRLADGSLLELDTDTAVDLRFDATTRTLLLLRGEILVTTGKDAGHAGAHRPFVVETAQGRVRALGTRFAVREDGAGETRIVVYEDAVEVMPAQGVGPPRRVGPAQQLRFSAAQVLQEQAAPVQSDAWTRGMRVAVDEPLDHFLAEMGRYHRGVILCDAAVAPLRVTGAYGLDDVPAAVASLQDSHPVRVRFLTRHLIRVSAR